MAPKENDVHRSIRKQIAASACICWVFRWYRLPGLNGGPLDPQLSGGVYRARALRTKFTEN